jgi:hypothetical protein
MEHVLKCKSFPHLFKYSIKQIGLAYRETFSDLELSKIKFGLEKKNSYKI